MKCKWNKKSYKKIVYVKLYNDITLKLIHFLYIDEGGNVNSGGCWHWELFDNLLNGDSGVRKLISTSAAILSSEFKSLLFELPCFIM